MRRSQITLLAAVGCIALGIVALAAVLRVALLSVASDASAAETAVSAPINVRVEDLTGFDGLVIRDSWQVEVREGDEWRVELSVPEAQRDDLAVRVENGRLVLDLRGARGGWTWSWFDRREPLRAEIVMPVLSDIAVQGSADIELDAFDGGGLAIEVSGAANLEARNSRFDRISLELSGASNIDLSRTPVVDAEVQLAGANNVMLEMDGGRLTGTLSGFGNVTYSGTVSEESVAVRGFGSVGR